MGEENRGATVGRSEPWKSSFISLEIEQRGKRNSATRRGRGFRSAVRMRDRTKRGVAALGFASLGWGSQERRGIVNIT